ncbi:MAG: twin-arginine translocase subunit TatC [Desulfamplus sp.]|nr:twin-arginine translocase subunit TatC [Desulfamplus sp.]
MSKNEDDKLPFTEHLSELRDRLIRCTVAIIAGFLVAYIFKEKLFDILNAPLVKAMGGNTKMIFTGLPEAFFTYMKLALLAGVVLATPVLFYEFWMFISPGLYRTEKKFLVPAVFLSVIFFAIGSTFGYFIVFPYAFQFFLGFSSETIQAMPSMKEYLSFSSKMLLAFGFSFELPLILTLMARMGLVSVDFLKKNRKYAILIIFIVAAVITPPDVVSQIMMAIPLMILYELSIIGAKFFSKKSDAQEDPDDQDDDSDEKKENDEDKEKKDEL